MLCHTHHVLHPLWTLKVCLAFQPLHIICLFLILPTHADTETFILTWVTSGSGRSSKWQRCLTFSSCVLILLVSSCDSPSPSSPFSSLPSSSSLSWMNLWKLERKFHFHKWAFRCISRYIKKKYILPFLQLLLLLNVAGRCSSLWKKTRSIMTW